MRMRRFRMALTTIGGLLLCLSFVGCNTELRRARESVQKEDFLQAALLFEKVIKKDPDEDDALRELTKLYCVTLKNSSFKCFGKSRMLFKKFPKDTTVKGWYSKALYENSVDSYLSNQLKRADRYLEEYSKLDPKNGYVFFMRANIKFRLNRKPPRNDSELKEAIKLYALALKNSKKTDMVALSSKKQKALLQWECHMQSGGIYEFFIKDKFNAFMKDQMKKAAAAAKRAAAEAKKAAKKKRRRRRRRRRRGKKKKEEAKKKPQFKPDPEIFKKAIEHFKQAGEFSTTHPNKFKRPLPFFKIGMFYANFKGEFATALSWMEKAEKWGSNDVNVIGNMKMMYDKLAEAAEEAKDKARQKEYETKAQEYASKFDSLKGRR